MYRRGPSIMDLCNGGDGVSQLNAAKCVDTLYNKGCFLNKICTGRWGLKLGKNVKCADIIYGWSLVKTFMIYERYYQISVLSNMYFQISYQ